MGEERFFYHSFPRPRAEEDASSTLERGLQILEYMKECHSASNRDPGRYRHKSLNKHGYCTHGRGPDWTPIKSPRNRQF